MKTKLILSLSTMTMLVAPLATVISCGNDNGPATPGYTQAQLDTLISGITLTAPTEKNMADLDAFITTADQDFTATKVTELGLTGTLPTLPEGVTLKYSFAKGTQAAVLANQGYVLTIKGAKEGLTTATKTVAYTSYDFVIEANNTINISTLNPSQVMDEINKRINVYMQMIGTDLIKPANFGAFKQYTKGIKANKTITLTDGTNSFDMDFSEVQENVEAIIELQNNPESYAVNAGMGATIGMTLIKYKSMPEIAALSENAMGTAWATGLAPFMELNTAAFDSDWATGTVGSEADAENALAFKAFMDEHAYFQMLRAYHRVFWSFFQSPLYTSWKVGKTYTLPVHIGFNVTDGATQRALMEVKTGEYYDDVNVPSPVGMIETHDGAVQTSNFEALWALKILNVDSVLTNTKKAIFAKDSVKATYSDWTDANFSATNGSIGSTLPAGWLTESKTGEQHKASIVGDYFFYVKPGYAGMGASGLGKYFAEIQGIYYKPKSGIEIVATKESIKKSYNEFTPFMTDASTANLTIPSGQMPAGWSVTENADLAAIATADYKFATPDGKIYYTSTAGRAEMMTIFNTKINSFQSKTLLDAAAFKSQVDALAINTPTVLTPELYATIVKNADAIELPTTAELDGAVIKVTYMGSDVNGSVQASPTPRAHFMFHIEKNGFKSRYKSLMNTGVTTMFNTETLNTKFNELTAPADATTTQTTKTAQEAYATILNNEKGLAYKSWEYDQEIASKLGITIPTIADKVSETFGFKWIATLVTTGTASPVVINNVAGTITITFNLAIDSTLTEQPINDNGGFVSSGNYYTGVAASAVAKKQIVISGFKTTTA